MTPEQTQAIAVWIKRIARYGREGDVIVRVVNVNGGSAEVRFTPEGDAFSTTTGKPVGPPA